MLVILKSKGATSALCEHFQLVVAKNGSHSRTRTVWTDLQRPDAYPTVLLICDAFQILVKPFSIESRKYPSLKSEVAQEA